MFRTYLLYIHTLSQSKNRQEGHLWNTWRNQKIIASLIETKTLRTSEEKWNPRTEQCDNITTTIHGDREEIKQQSNGKQQHDSKAAGMILYDYLMINIMSGDMMIILRLNYCHTLILE